MAGALKSMGFGNPKVRNAIKIIAVFTFPLFSACDDGGQNSRDGVDKIVVDQPEPYRPLKHSQWHQQNVKCYGDEIRLLLTDAKLIHDETRLGGSYYDIDNAKAEIPLVVPTRYIGDRLFWEPGDIRPYGLRRNNPEKPKKFWPADTQPKCLEEPIKIGGLVFGLRPENDKNSPILDALNKDGYFNGYPYGSIIVLSIRYSKYVVSKDQEIKIEYRPYFSMGKNKNPIVISLGVVNSRVFIPGNIKLGTAYKARKSVSQNVEGYTQYHFLHSIPIAHLDKVNIEMARFVDGLIDPDYMKAWKDKHWGEK